MKKLLFASAIVLSLVLLPTLAHAAQFHSGDKVEMSGPDIKENVYIGAGEVTVNSPITGDLFIAGGDINLKSRVIGDVFIAGGDITISGSITGDLRVAGGNITLDNSVSGDVMVGGGNVKLLQSYSVGQVWVGAGQLELAGKTKDVTAGVGELIVASTAQIEGNLSYTSEQEGVISPDARITGKVTRHIPPMPEGKKPAAAAMFGTSLASALSAFIMLILFMYAMPHKAAALATSWRQNFASNLLWGVIILIVTPVVALILLISFIGLPLGLITIVFYLVGLYLGNLVTILAIGMWLRSLWIKTPVKQIDWLSALLGLAAIALISLIPVIGAAAIFVAFVAGLGTLVRHDWGLYQRLRQNKEF